MFLPSLTPGSPTLQDKGGLQASNSLPSPKMTSSSHTKKKCAKGIGERLHGGKLGVCGGRAGRGGGTVLWPEKLGVGKVVLTLTSLHAAIFLKSKS